MNKYKITYTADQRVKVTAWVRAESIEAAREAGYLQKGLMDLFTVPIDRLSNTSAVNVEEVPSANPADAEAPAQEPAQERPPLLVFQSLRTPATLTVPEIAIAAGFSIAEMSESLKYDDRWDDSIDRLDSINEAATLVDEVLGEIMEREGSIDSTDWMILCGIIAEYLIQVWLGAAPALTKDKVVLCAKEAGGR